MKFEFEYKQDVPNTFRTEVLKSAYDLSDQKLVQSFSGNLELESKNWSIGLIVGSSGSGKSSIIKNCFADEYIPKFDWSNNSLIEDFDKDLKPQQIFDVLSQVGFNCPPLWLKQFGVLSNGQKMRVELARAMVESPTDKIIVYDEFTSVVDRQVAKIGCHAIQKYIRFNKKRFIAVSCHHDVIDWLQPDWIYDTDEKRFFFIKKQDDQPLNFKLLKVNALDGNVISSFTI